MDLGLNRSQLPSDWWQRRVALDYLIKSKLSHHMIGLELDGTVGQDVHSYLYTGFILEYKQHRLWVSAGHVIDEIRQVLNTRTFNVTKMAWLDGYQVSQADEILVYDRNLYLESWYTTGVDMGVVILSATDADAIFSNKKLAPITKDGWTSHEKTVIEGYLAAGFPRNLRNTLRKKATGTLAEIPIDARITGFPIRRTSWQISPTYDEFWDDSTAFYGEILPYPDYPDEGVGDIGRMSGSPLFSFSTNDQGRVVYYLAGVLKTWDHRRTIRVVPIQKIIKAIDEWISLD